MGESTKVFFEGLLVCVVFALAAAIAALVFQTASNYTTCISVLNVYSIGWIAACALSFICGLLLVPRSPGIFFAFAGLLAFVIICALNPVALSSYPILKRMIQLLPALLFIAAWAAISISACRSKNNKIRFSSWVWLAIFLILLSSWCAFQVARVNLLKLRNRHIIEARSKTLLLVEQLENYKAQNNAYPASLDMMGLAEDAAALSYRGSHIKYFGHGENFVLTFDDPMLCNQQAFSYDTAKDGWFPSDPEKALTNCPQHMYLGYLRKK